MKNIKVRNITTEGIDNPNYMKMTVTYGEGTKEYDFKRKANREKAYRTYSNIFNGN